MIAVAEMEMRQALASTMRRLMQEDDRVVVINADLAGALGFAGFVDEFPGRAFDIGIQESNMASFAAGLASYGFKPFIVTFTAFATRRIADQLAVSIAYAHNNVKVIGGDPGVGAEFNGGTHMSFEDVGIARSIPKMVVVEPADATQMQAMLPVIKDHPDPVYLRTYRRVRPKIYDSGYTFDLHRADILREGSEVTLFAQGVLVHEALIAADLLAEQGVSAEVINIATIKPLDEETVLASVAKTGAAVSCENHNVLSGMGAAITEVTAANLPVPVLRIGSQDEFGEVGKLPYLLERFGMTGRHIADKAIQVLALKERLSSSLTTV